MSLRVPQRNTTQRVKGPCRRVVQACSQVGCGSISRFARQWPDRRRGSTADGDLPLLQGSTDRRSSLFPVPGPASRRNGRGAGAWRRGRSDRLLWPHRSAASSGRDRCRGSWCAVGPRPLRSRRSPFLRCRTTVSSVRRHGRRHRPVPASATCIRPTTDCSPWRYRSERDRAQTVTSAAGRYDATV
jgi:hypothetical protein